MALNFATIRFFAVIRQTMKAPLVIHPEIFLSPALSHAFSALDFSHVVGSRNQ
jgi:hypothetical protein